MAGLSRIVSSTFFAGAFTAAVTVALRPLPGEVALVVLPPWIAPEAGLHLVIQAGGSLLSAGGGGRLVRARFESPLGLSGLYAGGAVLVVRGSASPCSPAEVA